MKLLSRYSAGLLVLCMTLTLTLSPETADAQSEKPNIVVIWGDDIGYWNLSAYNQGMMGYQTPEY